MKTLLFIASLLASLASISRCQAQTITSSTKFRNNGLMDNGYVAFGAMLCPVPPSKSAQLMQAARDLKVESRHIDGFCEARADFIAHKLANIYVANGCALGKIWAFAPSYTSLVSSKNLVANNPLFSGEKIAWGYHVAPVFSVQRGNTVDTVVIDLAFDRSNPIEYHSWLKLLNCPEEIHTIIDYNYYLFYTLNGLHLTGTGLNGISLPASFPSIITGHFYYPALNDSTTVATGLAYNDLAAYLVDTYYTNPKYVGIRPALKAATTVKGLQQIVGGGTAGLPPDIQRTSTAYFNTRLKYWQTQRRTR